MKLLKQPAMERGNCSEEVEETSVQTTCGIHSRAALINEAVGTWAGDDGRNPKLTDKLDIEDF